jgi:glyoxylase-like metal-dependent hydrolase (beta-lactamase superfamily II)
MAALRLDRTLEFEYGTLETVTPLVRRVVAHNPSPFTLYGTATFVVGRGSVAVIDPGPDLSAHVEALLDGLRGERVSHILVTHTHLDHSPAAATLKRATGAKTYGFGPHGGAVGPSGEEGADRAFAPDVTLADGATIEGSGWRFEAVHTPGHTSNHLCYALAEEKILFSGDHVMGWSTSVISPPDGDMGAYLASLEKLLARDDGRYFPTHGPAILDPKSHVRGLIEHRHDRAAAILNALENGATTIPRIVAAVYVGLDPRLERAAGRSVLAHLILEIEHGRVACDGVPALDARFRIAR